MRTAREWARSVPTHIDSDEEAAALVMRIQADVLEDVKPLVEALKLAVEDGRITQLDEWQYRAKEALAQYNH